MRKIPSVTRSAGPVALATLLILVAAPTPPAGPGPLEAQTVEGPSVEGRVYDAETGDPVATARVSLLTDEGDRVGTTLTDGDGWFVLRAPAPGIYALEADRLGYGVQRMEAFEVAGEAPVRRDFPLATRAVEVEGIVVEGQPGQLLHDGTLSGVYARRARSPSVGSNRVLVRGDPDLERTMSLSDLLPHSVRPPPTWNGRASWCGYLWVDGWEVDHMGADYQAHVLGMSARDVVAVEFYRDHDSIPMSMRPMEEPGDFSRTRRCGLLAVWTEGAPR